MGREVAEKLVAAIGRRDADALADLFADDAVLHHPLAPEPARGKAAIRESERALFEAFSDIDIEVLRVVTETDEVAIEVVIRATNTGPLDVGADAPLPPPAVGSSFHRPGSSGSGRTGRSSRSATTSTPRASSASSGWRATRSCSLRAVRVWPGQERRMPAPPIVLVHGLWLTPQSWEDWKERFERRGHRVLAPAWPRMPEAVEDVRHDPSALNGLGHQHDERGRGQGGHDRQRVTGAERLVAPLERARDLEPEERVASGHLVDAREDGSWQRGPDPCAKDVLEGS